MQHQEHSHSQSAILGLQHLLSMYAGSILVPIMIASVLGYSATQLTYLISLVYQLFWAVLSNRLRHFQSLVRNKDLVPCLVP